MFYALVHYPNIDTRRIDDFRRQYDPHVDLIAPHLTLVFLVPETAGESNLVHHIETVLRDWHAFPIRLKGLQKSWDHWLFLILEQGAADVIRLHRELYTGCLAAYRRPDIEFIPHVGLGLFARQDASYDIRNPQQLSLDDVRYTQALAEARQLGLDYSCVVDRLHLLKINDDISEILWSREFALATCALSTG